MVVSIDHKQRVENYFIAWKNYDIELLKSIFSQSAKYIITQTSHLHKCLCTLKIQ